MHFEPAARWWTDESIVFDQWQPLVTMQQYKEQQAAVAVARPLVELDKGGNGAVQEVVREAWAEWLLLGLNPNQMAAGTEDALFVNFFK